MSTEWFVRIAENIYGPIDSTTLRTWTKEGRVTPETDVSRTANGPWAKAQQIKGLFSNPASAPTESPPVITTEKETEPKWYVNRDGKNYGPYSAKEMQNMAIHGQLISTDFVNPVGASSWVLASSLTWLNPAPPNPIKPLEVPQSIRPPAGLQPPQSISTPTGIQPPQGISVPAGLQPPLSIPTGGYQRVPPPTGQPATPQINYGQYEGEPEPISGYGKPLVYTQGNVVNLQWPPFERPSEIDGLKSWTRSAIGMKTESQARTKVLIEMVVYAVGLLISFAIVGWVAGFMRFYLYILGVGLALSLTVLAIWDLFQWSITRDWRTGFVFYFKRVAKETFEARQKYHASIVEKIQEHINQVRPPDAVISHVFEEVSINDWAILIYSAHWVGVVELDKDSVFWVAPNSILDARVEVVSTGSFVEGTPIGGASFVPFERKMSYESVLYLAVDLPPEDMNSMLAVKKAADRYAKQTWLILKTPVGEECIHFGRDQSSPRAIAQTLRAGRTQGRY